MDPTLAISVHSVWKEQHNFVDENKRGIIVSISEETMGVNWNTKWF